MIYFDTQIEYRHQVMTDFIETEMQRHKDIALEAISTVAHFEKESLTRILACSYLEENEDAVKLAYKLNLGKLEFLACIDDHESFKEFYLKNQEYELAQNF